MVSRLSHISLIAFELTESKVCHAILTATPFLPGHPHHHNPCQRLPGNHTRMACSLRLPISYTIALRCQQEISMNSWIYGQNL